LKPGTGNKPTLLKPSHPVRVRGLKRNPHACEKVENHVAPRAGAWVETSILYHGSTVPSSHPVRVRGLKLKTQALLMPAQ